MRRAALRRKGLTGSACSSAVFFGAAFGAVLGAGELYWFLDSFDRIVGWTIFVGCVVVCAFLAIRHGDDFWTGLRDWLWPYH